METLVLNWPPGRRNMGFPYYGVASSVWETASLVTTVQHHRLCKGQIMGPKLSQKSITEKIWRTAQGTAFTGWPRIDCESLWQEKKSKFMELSLKQKLVSFNLPYIHLIINYDCIFTHFSKFVSYFDLLSIFKVTIIYWKKIIVLPLPIVRSKN